MLLPGAYDVHDNAYEYGLIVEGLEIVGIEKSLLISMNSNLTSATEKYGAGICVIFYTLFFNDNNYIHILHKSNTITSVSL